MEVGQTVLKQQHPKETANVLSRLSFFYNVSIFLKGYKNSIESYDLYQILKTFQSKDLGDELEKKWAKEVKEREKPSICRALWSCYGKTFVVLGFMQLVVKTATTAWLPEALSKLVSYFSPGQTNLTREDAIYYASVVICLTTFNLFFYYNCMLALTELGIRVRTSVCSLLYRKSLKLSLESLSQVTVGKIVTIITKDVDVFFNFVYYGNDVWIPFVQTCVICYLIYTKIGIASLAGITFFLLVLPLQALIGKMSYPLRLNSSKKTDERLELIQEALSAIKIIKMYTWEKFFEKKIHTSRKEELTKLHKLFFTKVWIVVIGSVCPKIAFFIFFITYVYTGNSETNLTAEVVYYIMTCFSDLEYSLSTLIPIGLSYTAEAYAVTKRIESVLTAKELPVKEEKQCDNPKVVFNEVSVDIQGKTIFENVCLNISKGLNVVIGNVGSGKTVFLKTILQETCQGVKVFGKVSYASQEPWLFPSTIRNNILFGEKYDQTRYEEILRICSLDYDLNLLPEGDGTIVSDNGVNLSKGQQTRINLARALYRESDIYLLDDCLASLDVYVSKSIFEQAFLGFLKNKICIFVTTNLEHLSKADDVILIEGGVINVTKNLKNECHQMTFTSENKIKDEKVTNNNQQIYCEVKKSGKVSLKDYHKYISNGGGIIMFCLVMILFIGGQAATNYGDKLISNWVTLEQNLSSYQELNQTNQTSYDNIRTEESKTLNIYVMIFISSTVLALLKYLAFFKFTKVASINLHRKMTKSILNSSITFFDSNFLGNILNRFSKDCLTVDENLPFVLIECLSMVFMASGGIILLTSVNIIYLLESVGLLACTYLLKRFCQPTGRNLQRLNVASRSPMVGHINSSLKGLITIRASDAQEKVIEEFDSLQNLFTSANYMLNNCQISLGFGLECFCTIFIALVIVQFLITENDPSVGDVGLAISQSFLITDLISTGIKNIAECENLMTSVERIVEYTEIQEENKTGLVQNDWPGDGKITFDKICLSYDTSNNTLKNISFSIKPCEKLSIVGRTGAGKSSIIAALFRLYQTQGTITIDDFDIQNISLNYLRSKISVIPQDPFLFSGTIRENLDPLRQHKDDQIWKVLDQLQLKPLIADLNIKIDKSWNFSAGQKQLFCLARTILPKNKIVILDEATANVDKQTEDLMQKAVVDYFSESTVIFIAHKLESVLKSDKILVLNNGEVSEFGEPLLLLENNDSFLSSVIKLK